MGERLTALYRKISANDNTEVARIIRTVMPEFGAATPGFAIHDPEVDKMFETYQPQRSAYYVVELDGRIVGGGGIAPLKGGHPSVCELQKMYFLPEARGHGFGKTLLQKCLTEAKAIGFSKCYLETFNTMKSAIALYRASGFAEIPSSLGSTGHFACDTFFVLDLDNYFPERNI
jgi:putative acetyltransferase